MMPCYSGKGHLVNEILREAENISRHHTTRSGFGSNPHAISVGERALDLDEIIPFELPE